MFNTSKYPLCSLKITSGKWDGYRKYKSYGVLKLKGISKPIDFVLKVGERDTTDSSKRTYTTRLTINNAAFQLNNNQPSTVLKIALVGKGENF
jgi:polyisoprenoid-binding protein YceI